MGRDPAPEVRRLAGEPGVMVTGGVPDVRPFLGAAAAAVCPLKIARGIQNKVLEAMAMGVPVVATPIATRAFGKDCPGIVEAANAEKTIGEVARLLADPDLAAKIGGFGRDEALRNFSWRASVDKLELVYEEAIRDHGRMT